MDLIVNAIEAVYKLLWGDLFVLDRKSTRLNSSHAL